METEYMLSTIENPFDYFTDFRRWRMFDIEQSQRQNYPLCCEFLARVANISDDMTEKEKDEEIERAIDEIILYDFRNIYKKISRTTEIVEPMTV
jgi:hypothetical protein